MLPSARANFPFLLATAPVNAPFTWPNSSDSSSVSGMAAQLTLMSGRPRLRAPGVDGPRQQFLARAGLARDQDGALRGRHQVDLAQQLLHLGAAADDAVVGEVVLDLAQQVAVLQPQAAVLQRRAARPPRAPPPRTVSAGSRTRRAAWPRSRSRWWRRRSSSRPADGRSRRRASSRSRSRPVISGIMLSTTRTSKKRAGQQPLGFPRARGRDHLVALLAQGRAPTPSGSSVRRRPGERRSCGSAPMPASRAGATRSPPRCPSPAAGQRDGPAEALDDVARDGEPDAGARGLAS